MPSGPFCGDESFGSGVVSYSEGGLVVEGKEGRGAV